jgi:hypothetical protein
MPAYVLGFHRVMCKLRNFLIVNQALTIHRAQYCLRGTVSRCRPRHQTKQIAEEQRLVENK